MNPADNATRTALLTNADPFILFHNGIYYGYGTNHDHGFLVYESTDLKSWKLSDNGRDGFALKQEDIWGEKWYWAPEIYHINGKFLIYFAEFFDFNVGILKNKKRSFVAVKDYGIIPRFRNFHFIHFKSFVNA